MILRQKGFTLVELLIVIALLGALVIGLLAALDPIEQIRKGQDTGIRNSASEIFQAFQRQYTNKGSFNMTTTFTAKGANQMGADISSLMNQGELKANFWDRAGSSNLSKILVTSTAGTDLAVCFLPISKGIQADPATIYGSDGQTSSASCKSQSGGTADCYICFR